MGPTLTRPPSAPPRNVGAGLLVGTGVAAIVVVALALLPGMRLPAFVPRVTVANATPYAIQVDLTDASHSGWLDLGSFAPGVTRNVNDVLDAGSHWIFRFTYNGEDVGQVAVTRAELKADHWRLTVPSELGDRLSAAGITPSSRG